MAYVGYALLALVLAFLTTSLVAWLLLRDRRGYDQVHTCLTGDGVTLTLHRLRGDAPGRLPVILCHGMGANHFNLDLGGAASLARILQARGWDVWLPDLRGRAGSRRGCPVPWSFDQFVEQDLPAILQHVRQTTGCERVHWVGHSQGGMVMYGYLGRHPEDAPLASFTAIASPWAPALARMDLRGVRLARRLLRCGLKRVRLDWLGRLGGWTEGHLPGGGMHHLLCARGNSPAATMRRAAINLASPISLKVVDNFGRAAETGRWLSDDGRFDYGQGWSHVRTPALFIAADRDHLGPDFAVRAAFEACGAPIKEWHQVGRATGSASAWGHCDLTWSPRAPDEVFPWVYDWLERHDPALVTEQSTTESAPARAAG